MMQHDTEPSTSDELWTEPIKSSRLPLELRKTADRGRGVFATSSIPAKIEIECSPILFFPSTEYSEHGRHTQLDHYTYVWEGTRSHFIIMYTIVDQTLKISQEVLPWL